MILIDACIWILTTTLREILSLTTLKDEGMEAQSS
jgi:hypothetical protein